MRTVLLVTVAVLTGCATLPTPRPCTVREVQSQTPGEVCMLADGRGITACWPREEFERLHPAIEDWCR